MQLRRCSALIVIFFFAVMLAHASTPQVTSTSPTSGPTGSHVQINGSGFGTVQGTVQFDSAYSATILTWTDTQISVVVPTQAFTGPILVTAGGVNSNTTVYFNVPGPQVTGVSPASGPIGTQVTVTGSGFQASKGGNSSITFGGVVGTVGTWSDTQIVATVPAAATTGAVKVVVNAVPSNQDKIFTVPNPIISSLAPSSAPVNTLIHINGSGFGASQGSSSTVQFKASNSYVTAQVSTWTDSSITATVPNTAITGPVLVTVGGVVSRGNVDFTVPAPQVTSVTPASGVANTSITITGSGFQTTKGSSAFAINGVSTPTTTWSDSQITATIPSSTTTGPITVSVNGILSNQDVAFTMVNPVITSISPSYAPVNSLVTVKGTGFGASGTLTIGGASATTQTWTDTQIQATVPKDAMSGYIQVTTSGVGSHPGDVDFTVTPPHVSGVSPSSGSPGSTAITVMGSGFRPVQAFNGKSSSLFVNGVAATVTSWSDTQILATVPATATTGPVTVSGFGATSNADIVFTTPNPIITSISPSSATVNTTVLINGSGFGSSPTVKFNGVTAPINSSSDTQISVNVPTTAISGPVTVTSSNVTSNNNINFTVPPPQITSISPTSGIVGTQVTITGSGFQGLQGSSSAAFTSGSLLTVVSWSDTQIVAKPQSGAVTNPIYVNVNGIRSNQDIVFSLPNPVISGIAPMGGAAGSSSIQINGSGFGATQVTGSTVTIGSVTATNIVWSDTLITATVPANATTGTVTVTAGGVASSANPTFTVSNVFVNSVSPQAGPVSTPITIYGSGFGSSGTLQINNVQINNPTWTNTQISATVPSGVSTGAIKVTTGGTSSNTTVTFTVSNVSVNSVSPTSGGRATQVQINGSGFGATKGSSTVTIGGVAATTGTWSDSTITATVPTSASTGPVVVTVGSSASNSTINFTVTSPVITSISPSSGAAGTLNIQISGSGFGTSGTLTFSGPGATAVNPTWTDTLITATVPSTATSGRVFVSANGLFSNTNLNFTVPNAVITSISPTSGGVNTQVTINGSGFGASLGSSSVTFNGVALPAGNINHWSDTQLLVTVPPSIRSGPVVVNAATTTNKDVVFTMPNPIVTSVTPANGPTGTPVQISGTGFGATQGTSTVTFNGQAGQNITWSDTLISATVPATASSGVVTVSVGGVPSTSTINFVVPPPLVTSMTPNRGLSGTQTQVTVTGSNFQTAPGNNHLVLSASMSGGSANATTVTWSDTQIVANVPSSTITGPAWVNVNGVSSNEDVGFTLTNPRVTSLAPAIAAVNTSVHINGIGFGDTQGGSSVQIGGNVAAITSWFDTQIIATVPTAAKSGAVAVFVSGVSSNNNINLTVPSPQITGISPSTGIVGSTVTITGSGFQTNRGTGTVSFNGASPNSFVSWSDTQIVVAVPSGATSGAVTVTANNGAGSNQDQTFTMPNPIVSSLVPASGPTGTQVQVNGVGFGGSQNGSAITFGGVTASVVSWSDTQVVATVPQTAVTGAVQITEGGVAGNSTVFFNVPAPTITSISPAVGGSGNPITITGTGFQTLQGSNSWVTFSTGGVAAIKSWSDTQIVAVVPSQTTTGFLNVSVNSTPSNYVDYTIPAQSIASLTPNTGPVGTQVTVAGTAFGSPQGTSTLTFNGQTATINSWTNTQIVATVPVTAPTGPAVVTVGGVNSNAVTFTVPPPHVGGLQPNGGDPGTSVTINGSGFQTNQRNSTVSFNGSPATVTTWGDTQIVVNVPSGATTGPVLINVNSVASQNDSSSQFEVPHPVITSITPPAAPASGTITISGSGFGATESYSPDGVSLIYTGFINFNGVQVLAQSWTDTSIVVTVPSNASSGSVAITKYDATSNSMPFSVEGAPTVATLAPALGPVGGSVVITGTGFGPSQSTSTIDFSGVLASVTNWTDTQITATVPPGSETGPVTVTVAGVAGGTQNFTINGSVQVTDSLGNTTNYVSTMAGGAWYPTFTQGGGCSSCNIRGSLNQQLDSAGNVLSNTDELQRMTFYTYDADGNVTSTTQYLDPNTPVVTSYTYNSFGEPLTVTDPLGNVTTNTYDANGNLLTVTAPSPDGTTAASVTQFAYDTKGQLTTITDPLNHITALTYYPTGLLHTIADAQSNVTSYEYDLRGNRTAAVDAQQNRTTFAYDAGNRLTGITYPDQTSVSYGYDPRGRRTSATDQNLHVTTYAYDDADRLISATDAANNVTTYGYDTENNLTSVTDANNHTTLFSYDAFGRPTQTTFPSTLVESYVYDAVGNLTHKTDRKNQTIDYVYDALNRLTHKGYPDSTGVDYIYDLVGKIKQVADPTGTYGRTYDNMGRLIGSTTQYAFLSGHTYTNSYSYDAASNETGFTAPDGSTNAYAYDTLNRLAGITDSGAGLFTFAYDGLSRMTGLNRPNGLNTTYGYDSLSRLLNVLHKTGATTLDGAGYTYDNAGNRASKTNYLNNITENYTYDVLYQLTQVTQGATTIESYTYEAVGNRLSAQGMSGYTYNSSNQLTSNPAEAFTYDANGNVLTKIDTNGVTTYSWDFNNRLTSVAMPGTGGTVTFKYDPFGRRIQKSGPARTTNYLYSRDSALADVDSSGTFVARYLQSGDVDQPLASVGATGTFFFETDGLNSVTSLSGTGGLTDTYTYTAFGVTTATGTNSNRFRYTGREWDQEIGLYYYRARYYAPDLGRFTGEDPWGVGGQISPFAYTDNNPLRWTDPFGLVPKVPRCPSGRITPYTRPELNGLIGPLSAADSTNLNRGCIGMTSAYQGMNVTYPETARGTQCFATETQARARPCNPKERKFIFAKQGDYAHGIPTPGPNGRIPNDTISSANGHYNYIVAFPGGCYGWMNFAVSWASPDNPQKGYIGRGVYPNDPSEYAHTIWCSTCCSNCMKSQ